MRTCQNCGRESADDADFCACGAYLRWEATNYQMPAIVPPEKAAAPAADPPPAAPPPAAPPPAAPPPASSGAPGPPTEAPAARPASPASPQRDQFVTGVRPAVPQPRRQREPQQPPPQPLGPNSTRPYPAVTPSSKAPRANPQAPPPAATISLRLPGDDAGADAGPVTAVVAPGDRIRVLADVRNQGGIVDNYSLVVHGLPAEWYSVMPETVYLVPLGSRGAYEQEVEIHFHPPRDPDAEARRWELRIGVYSHAAESEIASAPMTIGIHPYEDYTVRVRPERASGRRRAKYDVTIVNNANGVAMLAVDAQDNESACRFDFQRDTVELRAGESKLVQMTCRPPRKIWVGRSRERFFEIVAASGEAGEKLLQGKAEAQIRADIGKGLKGRLSKLPGVSKPNMGVPQIGIGPGGKLNVQMPHARGPNFRGVNLRPPTTGLSALKMPGQQAAPAVPAGPLLPTQAVFRQKPIIPWWLAMVGALLVLLLLLLIMLWPHTVEVPKLKGSKDVSAAQDKLPDGLVIGTTRNVVSKATPGSVIGQHPAAGTAVKKGSAVDVSVAVGTGNVTVPTLVGKNLRQAEDALSAKDLTMGAIGPTSPPDPKAKIISQLPSAGATAKTGSAIAIFYDDPNAPGKKKSGKKGDAKGTAGGGAAAAGGGGGGGDITIPPLKPASESGYGQLLVKLGLTPVASRSLNYAPAGTVIATNPSAGAKVAKGAKVALSVSAGFPLLAYDNQANVKLFNGKQIPAIANTDSLEHDPTWSPNGHTLVYVDDGQLVAADVRDRQDRTKLTSGDTNYAHPLFAPVKGDSVIAVVRVNGNDGDLCFGRVKPDGVKPGCIADDKISIRSAQWLPGGNFIIASATPDGGKTFGMYQYKSDKKYSANKENWHDGQWITEPGKRGVLDAAISPDGKTLAAASNIQGKGFSLYLTDKVDNIQLTGLEPKQILACKLAWIDNQNLAIVQFNADCEQGESGVGDIVRINIARPTQAIPLVRQADNPAFRLLTGG